MTGLEGVRVLELGQGSAAAYATKQMADLGADVVKVEDPSGDSTRARGPFPGGVPDPEQSGLFLYLNANKRGLTLDPDGDDSGERLRELVAWAEILVQSWPPEEMRRRGIDYAAFQALNPRLVMCSITPFGLNGPYRDYRAVDLTIQHGGGWAWLSPGASDRPEKPPLKAFGSQAEFQGGLAAMAATMGAYYGSLRTGRGEHVDLSLQAYVASFVEQNIVAYTYQDKVASRMGAHIAAPWGIYECQDGLIFLVVVEQDQWKRLVEMMGTPEWSQLEIFRAFAERASNADALDIMLRDWIREWKVEDLFRAGQEHRICFAPVFTPAQIAEQEHLRARGHPVEVAHPCAGRLAQPGAPYALANEWWRILLPAPLLGEHNGATLEPRERSTPTVEAPLSLPLEGVRVADFSWAWAGPFAAMHLAHLGAEVIRIESETRLDLSRRMRFHPTGMEWGPNRSGFFNQWNQGKRSVRINLSTREGVDLARRLVEKCDVVIDNFATGVMERLGLDYESLRAIRPDIIAASISGYGHTGPMKDYMGYGPSIAPLAGLSAATGYPGGPPEEVGISYGDPTAGITAAAAICAALVARARTGEGQGIDVSLWEATLVLTPEIWMEYAMNGASPPRAGNRDAWMAPHGCYLCAGEDAWVTLACEDERGWAALCRTMEREDLAADARFRSAALRKQNEDALDAEIERWTKERDRWAITQELQAVGVAAFPTLSSRDLVRDPQLNAREFFARLSHQEVGTRTHAGIPWRLSQGPNGVRSPAPLLGAATESVMTEVVGLSPEEVERLRKERVLY